MITKCTQQDRKASGWLLHSSERMAEAACRNDQKRLARARRWQGLIIDVQNMLPVEYMVVLSIRRYYRGAVQNENWMDEALDRYRRMSGEEISRRTFQRRWNEIVNLTAREALERKLL